VWCIFCYSLHVLQIKMFLYLVFVGFFIVMMRRHDFATNLQFHKFPNWLFDRWFFPNFESFSTWISQFGKGSFSQNSQKKACGMKRWGMFTESDQKVQGRMKYLCWPRVVTLWHHWISFWPLIIKIQLTRSYKHRQKIIVISILKVSIYTCSCFLQLQSLK
jgi:hypothetical protein